MDNTNQYIKKAYSMPKIELFKLKTFHCISINPDDGHQYFEEKDWRKRLDLFKTNQAIILNRILQPCKYILNIEVSEQGRLHWHGYIKVMHVDDLKRLYLTQIIKLKSMATYEVDTIKDDDVWHTYCNKQKDLWGIQITSEDKISKLALMDVESEVTYKKIPTFC